jgi:hypothetical protein
MLEARNQQQDGEERTRKNPVETIVTGVRIYIKKEITRRKVAERGKYYADNLVRISELDPS